LLCALVLAACARRETPVEAGNRLGILHLGNQGEPATLDPQIANGNPEYYISFALLEGLTTQDPADLSPRPGAAESWEVSPDGLVYTFHLRAGARWSNGDAVTSHDFLYSYRRILSPKLGSDYNYMLYVVKNARAYARGTLTDFTQVGFAAPDDRTLIVTLEHPVPYFLTLAAHLTWLPVHPPTIEKFGAIDQRDTPWCRPGNYIGNGPFVLTQWIPNQVVTVRKNPRYWDAARVRLNEVRFYPVENPDTEERMFRAGQLHVTSFVPPEKIDGYVSHYPGLLHLDHCLETIYYSLNLHHPPLDDVRVRRALALALDRDEIARRVLRGHQLPAEALTPPHCGGFTSVTQWPHDPAAARRLLAEAGFPGGAGFPKLSLLFATNDTDKLVAEAAQAMWKQTLGITVQLAGQEDRVKSDAMQRGDFDIGCTLWIADYLDPNTFLEVSVTGGGYNFNHYSNPEYDRVIAAAAASNDPARRFACFQRAEAILAADVPLLPLYHGTSASLRQPSVHGWHPTVQNLHPLKAVWLEKE
jgi:oligopeptide transport system substrate-binding protein